MLSLKVFVEGFYRSAGLMVARLHNLFPSVFAADVCDFVKVEVFDEDDLTTPLFSVTDAVLKTNGEVSVEIPSEHIGKNVFFAVSHNNSLKTYSAASIALSATTSFDFTTAKNQAYGGNQKSVDTDTYAMVSGDVTQDGNIESADYSENTNAALSGLTGLYVPHDLNGDGMVNADDLAIMEANVQGFYQVAIPE